MAPSQITLTPPATTQDPTTTTTQTHAALTTPFIYPPHCDATRAIESSLVWSTDSLTRITLLVLDSAAQPACQPSGWNRDDSAENFAFGGAVCPSGWDARRVNTAEEEAATTAYCCRRQARLDEIWKKGSTDAVLSDYSLDAPRPWTLMASNAACYRPQQPSDGPWTGTHRLDNRTAVFSGRTDVWDVHAAWHITWASSDLATLSPRPPEEVTEMLTRWVPGETTTATMGGSTPSETATSYPPGYKGLTESFLVVVGVPLLIVGFFVAMCVWAWCSGRKGRKKRDDDVPLESVKREQSLQ